MSNVIAATTHYMSLLGFFLTFVLDVHGQGCDDAGSDDVPLDSESEL